DHQRLLARHVGIFALRHLEIPVHPPDPRPRQQHPGDLPVLHEKPRRVARRGDDLFVPPMPRAHSITSTASPSLTTPAPLLITRPPAATPLTATLSPYVSPSVTGLSRARFPSTTITANSNAPLPRTIALSGATVTGALFTGLPSDSVAIIPGRSSPCGFAIVS